MVRGLVRKTLEVTLCDLCGLRGEKARVSGRAPTSSWMLDTLNRSE
jgi:hypothetical protein